MGLFQQPLCHRQALENSREIRYLRARHLPLSGTIIRKTPPCRSGNSRQNTCGQKNRGDPRSPLYCGRKVRGRGFGARTLLCCGRYPQTRSRGLWSLAAAPQDPAAILKTRFMAGVDNNTTASAKLANSAFFYPKKIAACFALGKSNWDASAATAAAPVAAGEESNRGPRLCPSRAAEKPQFGAAPGRHGPMSSAHVSGDFAPRPPNPGRADRAIRRGLTTST